MYLAAVSLRTSHFLSFIDIYGVMPSRCGDCDSSLSKAALGLFAAVRKAIMYLSPTAKCHTLHRSSFCVPFSVQQSKNMSYFPVAGKGIYGDLKPEIFGKTASHYYRNNQLLVFIHECPSCAFKMVCNDVAKKWDKSNKCHIRGETNIEASILHELKTVYFLPTSAYGVIYV